MNDYPSIRMNLESYKKLRQVAEYHKRTLAGQIRLLVDAEWGRLFNDNGSGSDPLIRLKNRRILIPMAETERHPTALDYRHCLETLADLILEQLCAFEPRAYHVHIEDAASDPSNPPEK